MSAFIKNLRKAFNELSNDNITEWQKQNGYDWSTAQARFANGLCNFAHGQLNGYLDANGELKNSLLHNQTVIQDLIDDHLTKNDGTEIYNNKLDDYNVQQANVDYNVEVMQDLLECACQMFQEATGNKWVKRSADTVNHKKEQKITASVIEALQRKVKKGLPITEEQQEMLNKATA